MKKHFADEPRQVTEKETGIILEVAEGCLGLEGDLVELGCYRGDTSLLLEKMIEDYYKNERDEGLDGDEGSEGGKNGGSGRRKRLWIYDSFMGLPEKTVEDSSVAGEQFRGGELYVTKREVVERFRRAGLKVPVVKKGFFEDLDSERDFPEEICFGFLDGDLYGSIKTSFRLCEPKVVSGGVLIVHDYNNPELPGVSRAVEEFLRGHGGVRFSVRESLAILRF